MGAEHLELVLITNEADLDGVGALDRGVLVRVLEPVDEEVQRHDRRAGVLGAHGAVILAYEVARVRLVVLGGRNAGVALLRVALAALGVLGVLGALALELEAAFRGHREGFVEHSVASLARLEAEAFKGRAAHYYSIFGGEVCSGGL